MPPLGKSNLKEIFNRLSTEVHDRQGKWVKGPDGDYWWDPFKNHTGIVSEKIKRLPIDAGLITADREKGTLYVTGGSNDYSIYPDNPERPKTLADFRNFAEGTGIEIKS